MFGLHNMRGSDEGMELIITGVIKGLADEVGFSLKTLALSHRCPRLRTFARGDKRLAADILVLVVRDLQKDNVEDIAFMVDHGKRSGSEHYVKIIVWAGRDKDRKRVLKNFCLRQKTILARSTCRSRNSRLLVST